MKNLKAKLLAAGMTAAMVVSMSAPVWAATQQGQYVSENATGATITKNVYTATGVTSPEATYNFSVAPASDAQIALAAAARTQSDDYTAKAGLASKTINKTITAGQTGIATDALFADTDFQGESVKPGVYAYVVTESDPTYTGAGTLTKDSTQYYVEVKVTYDSESQKNVVSGVTAQKISSDGTSLGSKVSSISFNDKYTEYGNEDPDDNKTTTDGDTSKGIVIKKTVSGTDKGNSGEFTFSITLTEDTTTVGSEEGAAKVNDGVAMKATKDLTSGTTTITAGTEFTNYGTYTFKLGDGEEIDIQVPAGTTYTVNETDGTSQGYTVSYKLNGASDATTGAEVSSQTVSPTSTSQVEFINSKDVNPLTGIVNNYGGLLMIVAIAAAGIVVLSIRRRREA